MCIFVCRYDCVWVCGCMYIAYLFDLCVSTCMYTCMCTYIPNIHAYMAYITLHTNTHTYITSHIHTQTHTNRAAADTHTRIHMDNEFSLKTYSQHNVLILGGPAENKLARDLEQYFPVKFGPRPASSSAGNMQWVYVRVLMC